MKIIYDPEVDTLRIIFTSGAIQESDEEKPGVILDYDPDKNLVGMEILDASKRLDNPHSLEYSICDGSSVYLKIISGWFRVANNFVILEK